MKRSMLAELMAQAHRGLCRTMDNYPCVLLTPLRSPLKIEPTERLPSGHREAETREVRS
ncbi:MAG: hypothetical protein HQL37_15250 [Alphaproteobacteria bacterium]|nr:hypothetical protein [Alphaproteobacteria bacterium]